MPITAEVKVMSEMIGNAIMNIMSEPIAISIVSYRTIFMMASSNSLIANPIILMSVIVIVPVTPVSCGVSLVQFVSVGFATFLTASVRIVPTELVVLLLGIFTFSADKPFLAPWSIGTSLEVLLVSRKLHVGLSGSVAKIAAVSTVKAVVAILVTAKTGLIASVEVATSTIFIGEIISTTSTKSVPTTTEATLAVSSKVVVAASAEGLSAAISTKTVTASAAKTFSAASAAAETATAAASSAVFFSGPRIFGNREKCDHCH
ncbi:MAG TPA: hypothetical protein PLK35_00800 [Candidatus Moranbacteria bacterium]|nr:hypothetical protein [Candidatus Moranbacteria bacterium]